MIRQVVTIIFWICALAALGLYWWDIPSLWWVAVLQTLAGYVAFPLVVMFCWSAFTRHWREAIVSIVLAGIVGGVYLFYPGFRDSSPTMGDGTITMVSANVEFGAGNPQQIIAQADKVKADVIVVVESTADFAARMQPLASDYPYRSDTPLDGSGYEVWILSKYPLHNHGLINPTWGPYTGAFQMPTVQVHTPYGPVAVAGVHTMPPVPGSVQQWRTQIQQVGEWAKIQEVPTLAAGDYNASFAHPVFRYAMSEAQDGVDATSWWKPQPTWHSSLPFVRIDHVMAWRAVPVDGGTFRISGSDHKGVWAQVSFPSTP